MKALKFSLVILLSISLTAAHAQTEKYEQLFAQGNEAYIAERYDEAITYFQTILAEGVHSAELYLNLGNAYLKNKNTAASILYYERGLLIDPGNERILNNLTFAENQRLDKIDPLPLPLGQRVVNSLFAFIPLKAWGAISIVLGVLGLSLYIVYRLKKRKVWWRASIAFYLISLALYGLTLKAKTLMENNTSAIVFEPRVLVLTEPKQEAPVIFELHEGTKVQVLGNFQEFTEVRLANGQTGWMKDRELRKIKLSY
jgi:tetratricopeptide (TPR) repeat protein